LTISALQETKAAKDEACAVAALGADRFLITSMARLNDRTESK